MLVFNMRHHFSRHTGSAVLCFEVVCVSVRQYTARFSIGADWPSVVVCLVNELLLHQAALCWGSRVGAADCAGSDDSELQGPVVLVTE